MSDPKHITPVRKLAAIMFTDIVEYTKLMEEDEGKAIQLLRQNRQFQKPLIEKFGGSLIKEIGDGILSSFSSTLNAVSCAIAIQSEIKENITLRISLHLGDVIFENNDVFGDGVNIASRLIPLAAPGSIVISEKVFSEIKNKQTISTKFLGSKKLKNVSEPVKIYAVMGEGLPSPEDWEKSKGTTETITSTNFPYQVSSFIAREKEIKEIIHLISQNRLVTLTGPGGTGKTRLALKIMEEIKADYRDGVFFVGLAPLSDPKLVYSIIAQTLKVIESPIHSVAESLIEFLQNKQILLVLDNFEHLVESSPIVSHLLANCADLKVIVTSRSVLHLKGEYEYQVHPLQTPNLNYQDINSLLSNPSVSLFLERAKEAKSEFELNDENRKFIAEICNYLDGLPLAIELAAARIKLFSPQALLNRLDNQFEILKSGGRDQPERHRTLRKAIEWSYNLLTHEEKIFFRRLSVFGGGCTIDAAEAICVDNSQWYTLDLISALVDKSLVQQNEVKGEPYFVMLETIKAFALDMLEKENETNEIKTKHAVYYLKIAEEAESHLTGPQQGFWLDKIETELNNFRLAMSWFETEENSELGLQLGSALWRFWVIRTMMKEGRWWLEKMLKIPSPEKNEPKRCKALNSLGILIHELSYYSQAVKIFNESLEVARRINDQINLAIALNHLGWINGSMGNYKEGIRFSEEGRSLNQRLNNKRNESASLNNLGWIAHLQGDLEKAYRYYKEGIELRKTLGDQRGYAYILTNLAWVEKDMGNFNKALSLLQEAFEILEELDDKQLIAWVKTTKGRVNYDLGENILCKKDLNYAIPFWQESGNLFGIALSKTIFGLNELDLDNGVEASKNFEVLKEWKQIPSKWGISLCIYGLGKLAESNKNFVEAKALYQESLINRIEQNEKIGIIESLEALGHIFLRKEEFQTSIFMYSLAQKIRAEIKISINPKDRMEYESDLQQLKENVGFNDFEKLSSKGKQFSLSKIQNFLI